MLMRVVAASLVVVVGMNSHVAAQQMPAPGPEHEMVLRDVGDWTIKGKMMMPQGMQDFEGEEKVVAIGGFWTVSHYSSDIFGGLKGSSTMGYDPQSKKYVGTWVDSFQPGATSMKGTYDKATKTMTYDTMGVGMDGKPMPGKIIIKHKDKNTHTFTMMHKDPTGQSDKMVLTMEMVYTRKTD